METCADLETAAPPHAKPHPLRRRHSKPAKHAWLREVGIVLGFYYVYQTIRSLANVAGVKSRAHSNANFLVTVEKTLFVYHEHSVQQAFLGANWFIKMMNVYYGTLHFIITAGLLIWLYAKRHDAYRRLRNLLGATTFLALIGYWAFPLAPPRLYLQCDGDIPALGPEGGLVKPDCFVDTLAKVGGLWNYQSSAAKAIANAYAAMPSLHFGWALWCAIVIWQQVPGRRGRVLAVLYPALTLFAIVVTANHFFLDAVGGVLILLGGLQVVKWFERRRSSKLAAAPAQEFAATE